MLVEDQIVASYEDHGIAIPTLSKEFAWTPDAIRVLLASRSSVYRAAVKCKTEEDITDAVYNKAKGVLVDYLSREDQPHLQFKAAQFLFNEKKGRNDTNASKLNGVQINIQVLNERMRRAVEAVNKSPVAMIEV